MNASDICKKADSLVGGDRAETHGDKLTNHENIAALWHAYLVRSGYNGLISITALDVANMMELLKIARRMAGAHNIDDYIDGAGYASVAGEIAERLQVTPTESKWHDPVFPCHLKSVAEWCDNAPDFRAGYSKHRCGKKLP